MKSRKIKLTASQLIRHVATVVVAVTNEVISNTFAVCTFELCD